STVSALARSPRSRSIATRKAASVLPDPVGAAISVSPPEAIAGQPSACGSVGPSGKRSANQVRTAGGKAARASTTSQSTIALRRSVVLRPPRSLPCLTPPILVRLCSMSPDTRDDSEIERKVVRVLTELGVPYEVIEIDPAYADTAEFCARYGFGMDQSGNTIIVASKKEPRRYAACVVKATRRLDVNHTVRKLLGVPRLSFATADETMPLTGMMIGRVTGF